MATFASKLPLPSLVLQYQHRLSQEVDAGLHVLSMWFWAVVVMVPCLRDGLRVGVLEARQLGACPSVPEVQSALSPSHHAVPGSCQRAQRGALRGKPAMARACPLSQCMHAK